MRHYCDITLRKNPEIEGGALLNVLFNKLHLHLVANANFNIGVSFPQYTKKPATIGALLRLHGGDQELGVFISTLNLGGLGDHVVVGLVNEAPATRHFVHVQRVQAKYGAERLIKRCAKRHNISIEEAKSRYELHQAKSIKLPYLIVNSLSTGQQFSLFVDQIISGEQKKGIFSRYGFSQEATLPWF